MNRWIFTARVEPPTHTLTGRFGAAVLDCFYSQILDQWHQVLPGGSMEKIEEPHMLWLDPQWASSHPRQGKSVHRENPLRIRKTDKQLLLW